MTEAETREFLGHNKAGVLSLADQGRAYGVPLFYGYDGGTLYFFVRQGLKMQYARLTSEACFTVIRIMGLDDWASVQVFGELERVPEGPERMRAHEALMGVPLPPEWGESSFGEPLRSGERTAYYRLVPREISGRYSEPAPRSEEETVLALGGM